MEEMKHDRRSPPLQCDRRSPPPPPPAPVPIAARAKQRMSLANFVDHSKLLVCRVEPPGEARRDTTMYTLGPRPGREERSRQHQEDEEDEDEEEEERISSTFSSTYAADNDGVRGGRRRRQQQEQPREPEAQRRDGLGDDPGTPFPAAEPRNLPPGSVGGAPREPHPSTLPPRRNAAASAEDYKSMKRRAAARKAAARKAAGETISLASSSASSSQNPPPGMPGGPPIEPHPSTLATPPAPPRPSTRPVADMQSEAEDERTAADMQSEEQDEEQEGEEPEEEGFVLSVELPGRPPMPGGMRLMMPPTVEPQPPRPTSNRRGRRGRPDDDERNPPPGTPGGPPLEPPPPTIVRNAMPPPLRPPLPPREPSSAVVLHESLSPLPSGPPPESALRRFCENSSLSPTVDPGTARVLLYNRGNESPPPSPAPSSCGSYTYDHAGQYDPADERQSALDDMARMAAALRLEADGGYQTEDEIWMRADDARDASDAAMAAQETEIELLLHNRQRVLAMRAQLDCKIRSRSGRFVYAPPMRQHQPSGGELSRVLRAALYASGRKLVGSQGKEVYLASDWSRCLVEGLFQAYAAEDGQLGLAEFCFFIHDAKLPDRYINGSLNEKERLKARQTLSAEAIFAAVILDRLGDEDNNKEFEEEDGEEFALVRLANARAQGVRVDFGGFWRLLSEAALRCKRVSTQSVTEDSDRSLALEALAHDVLVPMAALTAHGQEGCCAERLNSIPLLADPRLVTLLVCHLEALWKLFALYAQDERGHTRGEEERSCFPELAQAAEHAIAGMEMAREEPLSAEFTKRAERLEVDYLTGNPRARSVALALSESRFARLCDDLGLTADFGDNRLVRAVVRETRRTRVDSAKKLPLPTHSHNYSSVHTRSTALLPKNSSTPPRLNKNVRRSTSAHRRRMVATATKTTALTSQRESHIRASPINPRTTTTLHSTTTTTLDPALCCPGLSFTEFVEALADLAETGLRRRKPLEMRYTTALDRVNALLTVWGAALPRVLKDLSRCVASHLLKYDTSHR